MRNPGYSRFGTGLWSVALFAAAAVQAQAPTSAPTSAPAVAVHGGTCLVDRGDHLFAAGPDFRARLSASGLCFEPALGPGVATTPSLQLTPAFVGRGATAAAPVTGSPPPSARGLTAVRAHSAGVEEHFVVQPQGVEVSWWFAARPVGSGDLVVRYEMASTLPAPRADAAGGLRCELAGLGGVSIGAVTGIDALGRRVAGSLRWQQGWLEMSLPAAFVEAASYPLVLDPLIGGILGINTSASVDGEPDAVYDASTDTWFVVFTRTLSAADVDLRGQRVSGSGTLLGAMVPFVTTNIASHVRVANLPSKDRFGVVWLEHDGSGNASVQFAAVAAASGSITHTAVVRAPANGITEPDICGDDSQTTGSTRDFVVVYSEAQVHVVSRRVRFGNDVLDQMWLGTQEYVLYAGQDHDFMHPAVSRQADANGRYLVAARKVSTQPVYDGIVVLTLGGTAASVSATIALDPYYRLQHPDCDGHDGRWVVAFEHEDPATGYIGVRAVTVTESGTPAQLTAGTPAAIGGTVLARAIAPTVGYGRGRSWVGYQQRSTLPSVSYSVKAAAYDSGACVACNEVVSLVVNAADTRIVVATQATGGWFDGEAAFAVWQQGDNVYAQRLQQYGAAGSIVDLGGGCGGGTQVFAHGPGIGSSAFSCTVSGLAPTALATIFNFAPAGVGLPCGPCVWAPFSVTLSPPVLGGAATVQFVIPCLPSLVGAQFETQWTTFDLAAAPCAVFPGLVLSPRSLCTIGN